MYLRLCLNSTTFLLMVEHSRSLILFLPHLIHEPVSTTCRTALHNFSMLTMALFMIRLVIFELTKLCTLISPSLVLLTVCIRK